MRVAVVSPYDHAEPGGVQQHVAELVERLAGGGVEAWSVTAGPGPGVGRTVRIDANQSTAPISLDPRVVARVRRGVEGADVVHVHEPLMPLVSWAAVGGRARVLTFHADPSRLVRSVYRLSAPLLAPLMRDAIVTAVSPVAASAVPDAWGPVRIIPNGIDVASYDTGADRRPERVVFLGRDEPRKGLDVLLEAWPEVRARRPTAELVVMGAARPSGPEGVRFVGRVGDEEKRGILATGAVHVAPNTGGESFGIVVAEGMAAGCAVVASDIPAFRHVLGDAGRLVGVGDHRAMSDRILRLLDDPGERARLGARAVERAWDFDWSVVVASYLDAYAAADVNP